MSKPMLVNGNCIRLLHIEADDTNQRQLHGSLRIADLSSSPPFAALSYVWGPYSSPADVIKCDGHDLKITANCWSALWHLRKVVGTLDIWVDAICIDQEDEADKVRQIPLMGDIYAKANPVYLWLGDGTEDSSAAIDYLTVAGFQEWFWPVDGIESSASDWRLAMRSFSIKMHFWNKGVPSSMIQEPILSTRICDNRISSTKLWSFLRTDWMNRIWTLQEAVLASKPVLCCGDRLLSWRSLVFSVVYLEYMNRRYAFSTPGNVRQKWRSLIGLWLSLHHDPTRTDTLEQPENATDLLDHDYVTAYIHRVRNIHKYYTTFRVVLTLIGLLSMASLLAAAIVFRIKTDKTKSGLDTLSLFIVIYAALLLGAALVSAYRKISPPQGQDRRRLSSVHSAVLNELFSRNTSEPRDKYLGLYSVLQRLGVKCRAPDTSMSQSEVYQELFLGLVKWGVGLDLILCAPMSADQESPSWTPKFDISLDANTDYYRSIVRETILGDRPLHQATSIVPFRYRQALVEPIQLPSRNGILVSARRVDSIIWRCKKFDGDVETQAKNLCDLLCKVLELKTRAPSRTQHKKLRSIGRPSPVYKIEISYADNIDGGGSYEARTRLSKMGHVDNRLGPWTGPLWEATHFSPQAVQKEFLTELERDCPPILQRPFPNYVNVLGTMAADTVLFVTSNGLIGGGQGQLEADDDVFLVRGVSMPLILRSFGEFYKLVGYAEIEGMMSSQFWPDDNVKHMERITLI